MHDQPLAGVVQRLVDRARVLSRSVAGVAVERRRSRSGKNSSPGRVSPDRRLTRVPSPAALHFGVLCGEHPESRSANARSASLARRSLSKAGGGLGAGDQRRRSTRGLCDTWSGATRWSATPVRLQARLSARSHPRASAARSPALGARSRSVGSRPGTLNTTSAGRSRCLALSTISGLCASRLNSAAIFSACLGAALRTERALGLVGEARLAQRSAAEGRSRSRSSSTGARRIAEPHRPRRGVALPSPRLPNERRVLRV